MNKMQVSRWIAAVVLFENLIKQAEAHNANIMMDEKLIGPENIQINDGGIYVVVGNCTYTWFECNPGYDHGVYTSKQEFAKRVRQSFKLCKLIKF